MAKGKGSLDNSFLGFMLDRQKEILGKDGDKVPPYREPHLNAAEVERAVAVHQEANPSDPFAGARMRIHLRRGLDSVSAVTDAARSALRSRHVVTLQLEAA